MKECKIIPGELNVYGGPLKTCSCDPLTGYTREGSCILEDFDYGTHTVCSVLTEKFLYFSMVRGNDLITPRPGWDFPGLKAGDRWCLCAKRWLEAAREDAAPPVVLEATNKRTLEHIPLDLLEKYAYKEEK